MEMQMTTPKTRSKPASPSREALRATECTICKEELVLDAQGAAVFCDECWAQKCLELPAD